MDNNAMRPLLTFALLITLIGSAHAAGDLNCTINGASEVTADGNLNPLQGKKDYYETVAGAEFIVQRDSGTMMGRFVNNTGYKVTVVDKGSPTNSFKVLSVRGSGRVQSQYFEVRLQDKGEKKPFVLVAAEILHGFCSM
jgi:hypothetical protein